MYTLHYAPDNASLIVRLALEQCGAPYVTRLVDRGICAQRSPDYLTINPAGLIPALETPHGALFETGAILLYLSAHHPGLFPSPKDAAYGSDLSRLFFISNTLHPALRVLFYPSKHISGDTSALLAQTKTRVLSYLALLDNDLHAPPFATQAYLCCTLRWLALYGPADRTWFRLADTPNLHAIATTLEALPCTAKAIAAEGLGPTPFTAPQPPNPPEGRAL